jgi:pimeloyl-ACP methyl ester carboxylesterase
MLEQIDTNKLNIPKAGFITANEHFNLKKVPNVTAQEWFALGNRVPYDRQAKQILHQGDEAILPGVIKVFRRITNTVAVNEKAVWASFLPGWPDGSFGWSKVDQHLTGKYIGPRLFVEYVGHGDSDKPDDYAYSTHERADLVEAFWRAEGVKSTFIIAFDYSTIVALELLSRQQERRTKDADYDTVIEGVLLINGGLFAEAHTHPWFTTPVLKSPIGGLVTSLAKRSRLVFGELMKPLWSKKYTVTSREIDELYEAVGRRNGTRTMSNSADFVDQHKQNPDRWNLSRLYHASRDTVSFHIVGSEDDPFEGRQAIIARERLGEHGLDVRILPGGHLLTSEYPDLLAQIILEVVPSGEPLS